MENKFKTHRTLPPRTSIFMKITNNLIEKKLFSTDEQRSSESYETPTLRRQPAFQMVGGGDNIIKPKEKSDISGRGLRGVPA